MKRFLILSIFLLQTLNLPADTFYCKKIGIENGLSQSSVTDIVYDGNGAVWIGTRFGLNEYRNGSVRVFTENETGSIKGNFINFLFCDSEGTLWTSTDKGLFKYDAYSDSFFQQDDRLVLCAVEKGDSLFFGGVGGISVYSKSGDSIVGEIYKGAADEVRDLYTFEDGILEVDRNGEVSFMHDGETEKLIIPEIAGKRVQDSEKDGNTLYLSVMKLGLVIYDLSGKKETRVFPAGEGGLPVEHILSMIVVNHNLWLGTDGAGIRIFNPVDCSFSDASRLNYFRAAGQAPLSVLCLYHDPMGNIWVGSVRNGAFGLKPTSIKPIPLQRGNTESVVIALFNSNDGKIYIGTDGNGVFSMDPTDGEIRSYPGQDGAKITAIADFDRKSLVLFIYNRGFFLMDRQTGELSPFILADRTTNDNECFQNNTPGIFNLGDGRILITALNTYIYDGKDGSFDKFTRKVVGNYDDITVIGYAPDGKLYGYSIYGFAIIDLAGKKIDRIFRTTTQIGIINTAAFYNGDIIFGTNYGLYLFNISDYTCEKQEYGVLNRVSRLHYAIGGNLWIAADNAVFLCRNGIVEIVGENRGLQKNEILSDAFLPNGSLLLGGTAGLIEIENNFPFDKTENKMVDLYKVSVNGQRAEVSSGKLTLPYKFSSLGIAVTLIGADPFERVMYRYCISGSGSRQQESFEDEIYLSSLQSGRHRVDVSYLKSNGSWSEPETVLEIRVLRPWYSSMLMIVVYVLLLLSMVLLLSMAISRRQVRRMEAELITADKTFKEDILKYIDAHLAESSLNVGDISVQMAMSRATLYNKVKASFGQGVADLIEERRMVKAEELLKTTSLSMLEISETIGFSTSGYFSTRFKKKHSGVTPLKYRQTNR